MIFLKKSSFLVINLLLVLILSSCQPRISKHGNFFEAEKIKLIKKTKLNKSEITEIFGQPTTTSTFSDNVWYYISFVQSEKAYFAIKNIENKILVVTFDKNQIVKKYKILDENDSIEINISELKTSSSLNNEQNLIQEFFSSFIRRLDDKP